MSSGSKHPGQVVEQLAGGCQIRDVILIQKYEPHGATASLETANNNPVSEHQPIRSRALEAVERFPGMCSRLARCRFENAARLIGHERFREESSRRQREPLRNGVQEVGRLKAQA